MRESFTKGGPDQLKKRKIRREINEGIAEHLAIPVSKEGIHPELADTFDIETAEQPLRREEVAKDIEDFVGKNLDVLLPDMLSAAERQHYSDYSGYPDYSELIQRLGITNEDIGLLGANYYIREKNGKPAILKTDEYYTEGTQQGVSSSDLFALAYAKENIRIDSKRDMARSSAHLPHRYYLRAKNRYLCTNDFGMRGWNEEEKKMDDGNITNANSFVESAKQQIERIAENLASATEKEFSVIYQKLLAEVKDKVAEDGQTGYRSDREWHEEVERPALEQLAQNLTRRFTKNPKDKELILGAIPVRKVRDHLHFNFDKIARKYGFTGNDPEEDYQSFDKNASRLDQLLREPTEQERAGASFNFMYSDFYQKPVINGVGGNLNRGSVISEARSGVKDVLVRRAIEVEKDPKVRELFERARLKRGRGSPFFYPDYQVYDFIKLIGAEQAELVLDTDERTVSEQMTGFAWLKSMKYDFSKIEPAQFKKQLHHANALDRSGLWRYLEGRNKDQIQQAAAKLGLKAENKDWLELLGTRGAREQFRIGKRMYYIAKQVSMHKPNRNEEDRFYKDDSYVSWDKYDLTKIDISEESLNKYLEKDKNLIIALLLIDDNENPFGYGNQQPEQTKPATLGLIIKALEQGHDLRGVGLAIDKQRYLEGLIAGKATNDLEFAMEDWPADWHKAVSPEEANLYYEYASDYVLLDPNGLSKYAAWRASEEGKEWDDILKEAPTRKADLDFRICLGTQTEEVRRWYKSAAEHVGGSVMQNYLLRFNATRGTDGRMANWHDVLLWSPNIQKLESGDARSILLSIETMDDNQEFINLLPRYSKERDPLQATNGPVQSLRELKKRVLGIESNIDLSEFPPELLEITSAPGFNLVALESIRKRSDFKDLIEGKLDKTQPFKPHSRIFAGRALTEALREGLGSQKQKIRGTARDAKGLFHTLNQLVKGREVGEKKMTTLDLLDSVPTDLEEEVIRLLREQEVNVGPIVEARIHDKSDPEGWVCGNYTDCCMPFGDPKNDDYMFNRSTQYFTVKYNGRIIAQSVVVDSINRENREDVVVLDNIEVANNYKNLSPLLANVYQTFWTEYTSTPVKVGTGYSDLIPPGGKLETNKYRAKTQLTWSDATGSHIYDLPKLRGVESMDRVTTFANLSERDAELIAKMEAEAYPEGMVQGKAHILDILEKQRELEVPGAASSFVVRQGSEPAGYLLLLPEESETKSGERVAHIYDMVVLPKFRGSAIARKMMERVLDVASAYGVPIEAEARASTSYALLMNARVRKWFESKGFYLTKNEKLPAYLNGEDFYSLRFENRQGIEATI
ncbi:MAG: GNAT family N-acetyltransferase [Candidatus Pacebacteria bacterium]|nr:GNAT family N-acetyltransferase [Candidatus Paceibacterota bacterium]